MHTEDRSLPPHLERKKMQFRYHRYMNLAQRAQKRGNRTDFDHFYQFAEYYLRRANGFEASLPGVLPQFPSVIGEAADTSGKEPSEAEKQWLLPQPWDPQNRRHTSCNMVH